VRVLRTHESKVGRQHVMLTFASRAVPQVQDSSSSSYLLSLLISPARLPRFHLPFADAIAHQASLSAPRRCVVLGDYECQCARRDV
jgi:hypothetical protein